MSRKSLELCVPESEEPLTAFHISREPLPSGDFLTARTPLPPSPPQEAWVEIAPARTGSEGSELWEDRTQPSEHPPPVGSTSDLVTIQRLGQFQRLKAGFTRTIPEEWQPVVLLIAMFLLVSIGFVMHFVLMARGRPTMVLVP